MGLYLYDYIKGLYIELVGDFLVIDNNGIGYKIYTSGNTISNMPKIDEEVKVFIQQIVREDFIGLYGFLTKEELEMFKLLLTINGVGAKASLSLLSISNVTNLKYSILTGDIKTLIRAPGIGNKTAQRIILELKDKLSSDKNSSKEYANSPGNISSEVTSALISLGYTDKEVSTIIKDINILDTVENNIKKCLRALMN